MKNILKYCAYTVDNETFWIKIEYFGKERYADCKINGDKCAPMYIEMAVFVNKINLNINTAVSEKCFHYTSNNARKFH